MYEAVESSDQIPPPPHPPAAAADSFIHNNLLQLPQTLFMGSVGGLAAHEEDQFLPPPDFSTTLHPSYQFSTGGVAKRPKIQHSASSNTIKVRKEKLGDKITALHQLVSPFGKTDTATVLLEAIGYIKFLEKQIKALSVPYMGHGSSAKNIGQQQYHALLKGKCIKRKGLSDDSECDEEPKKSLRSRGLCLVPISCTLDVGSELINEAADYWAPMHNLHNQ